MTPPKSIIKMATTSFQDAELLISLSGGNRFVDDDDIVGDIQDQSNSRPITMDVDQVVPSNQILNIEEEEINDKEWKSYNYTVPWDNINLSILTKLNSADRDCREPDPKDVQRLKQWIMTDLFNSYESFKDFYYVKTKTPGMKIYESVSSQVIEKYNCIKNMYNKQGYAVFLQGFSHSMENKGRRGKEVDDRLPLIRPTRRAIQAKGTAGVIADEYNPEMTNEMEETQEDHQNTLQIMHITTRAKNMDTQAITKLMHQSYELQRRDITAALKIIAEKTEDDQEAQSEIGKLKSNWPFLFELRWQTLHFLRLCGQNLEIPMQEYCENDLRVLLQYLTNTSTESGIQNIAELWKWEDAGRNPKVKLLLAMRMLSNFFSEKIDVLVKTAERTSPDYDLVTCVPDLTGDLTIIVLDNNVYSAEKFYVCLDREVVLTTSNSTDATTGLMQTAFIFDAHYPDKMKFTFEFLERVICRLGGDHTKRSAPVLTMSASVTRLVNNIDKFTKKLSQSYQS